ncbi:MAG: sugar ABC transporter substrate-binding protein [Candidatus Dormibacteria bacterium]
MRIGRRGQMMDARGYLGRTGFGVRGKSGGWRVAAVLPVLALLVSACGTTVHAKHYVVGLASEGLNAAFPLAIANGVKSVAAKDGVKAIVLNGNLSVTTQAGNIQTLIADHVNGIIIDVISPGETVSMVKEANAAHIPVMLVHGYAGATPDPVYPGVAFEIVENEVKAGKEAGALALKVDPAGGQVGIITGTPGYVAVTERMDGFESVIKPTGKYNVVGVQSGGWTLTGGYTACANMLQAHPNISLFFTEADTMAEGCVKAEKAAGSHAKLLGIGGQHSAKPLVASGAISGTVCYEPFTEGQTVMTAMYKQLTGQAHYNRTLDFYSTPALTAANINSCGWQW